MYPPQPRLYLRREITNRVIRLYCTGVQSHGKWRTGSELYGKCMDFISHNMFIKWF